jgi:hypothetical protein
MIYISIQMLAASDWVEEIRESMNQRSAHQLSPKSKINGNNGCFSSTNFSAIYSTEAFAILFKNQQSSLSI